MGKAALVEHLVAARPMSKGCLVGKVVTGVATLVRAEDACYNYLKRGNGKPLGGAGNAQTSSHTTLNRNVEMGQAIRVLQKRRKSRRRLADLMNHPEQVVVIHYSCESFYDRPDGSSPRITSIAVANLESAQARSFSIHQVAERKKYTVDEIEDRYDELERVMLDEFYEFVRSRAECTWLHWNMRNIHYGFQAIAHRHKVLGGQPVEIHESKLVDLARLLHAIYGRRYISHPRLQKLVKKNRITDIDFLSGAEEATAFESGEYVKLHFSTLRKVDTLANIAQRADEGSLKTNSTWKDSHGIYPQAVGEWLNENWLVLIIEMIFAIIGFVWTVIEIYSHFSS